MSQSSTMEIAQRKRDDREAKISHMEKRYGNSADHPEDREILETSCAPLSSSVMYVATLTRIQTSETGAKSQGRVLDR